MRGPCADGGPDRRYEALGRVMAALSSEGEILESCRDLIWWRGSDHCWHIEWRDGPHAAEVATLLVERVHEPEADGPPAGLSGPATPFSASLDVMGVNFVLRAIDPLGSRRMRARPGRWRMAAVLQGAAGSAGEGRRGGARQCWEELLGG